MAEQLGFVQRLPGSNIFVLPDRDKFIVYAPVRGLVFAANAEAVVELQACCQSRSPASLSPAVTEALGGTDWIFEEDRLTVPPGDRVFEPNRVTLFLTNQCNLRCTYCYAEAGDRPPVTMDETLWRTAIDYVYENARSRDLPLHVGFHGGGEPTRAWEVLTGAVDYIETITRDHGPGVRLALVTNGVMGPAKADFIMAHFPGVVLSMDGPRDLQDRQRPLADGRGSHDRVMATAARFRQAGFTFAVRATITAGTVGRMAEMVDFFVNEVGSRSLHFEPAFGCGRLGPSDDGVPGYDDFAAEFIKAFERGLELGAVVRYSAARVVGRRLSFCGVAQGSFNVTPDGLVTSCYEVVDAGHPLAAEFIYGRFDPQTRSFQIDSKRLDRLRSLVVPNKPYCDHCFCRWQCAGDCPVRVRGTRVDFLSPSPRCEMNQKITAHLLKSILERQACRKKD